MSKLRIDRFLSDCKICTRSDCKKYIKMGAVKCNGNVMCSCNDKIETETDSITVNGVLVRYRPFVYYMLNKPLGYVSATIDNLHSTVCELIKTEYDIFPVGRLDIDTEGLLLLTNDGTLAHELLAPGKHVDKTYFARVKGHITEEEIQKFKQGFDYGEKKSSKSATIKIINPGELTELEITISEGKFHQVKRMFEVFNQQVTYLKRISMGKLVLDPALESGQYRELTQEEISILQNEKRKK